jgi:hypothetical protein
MPGFDSKRLSAVAAMLNSELGRVSGGPERKATSPEAEKIYAEVHSLLGSYATECAAIYDP